MKKLLIGLNAAAALAFEPGDSIRRLAEAIRSAVQIGGVMTERVLIINLPPLLRQIIVDALESDGRVEMVDCNEESEDVDLVEAIQQHEPDVIVTASAEHELDPACRQFLSEQAGRRVLTIERVGRSAYLFSMEPEPLSLGEMSADALVRAIHDDLTEH